MDKIVVTVLLIISGLVATVAVFNAIYPAITRSSGAIVETAASIDSRIKSQIDIIEVAASGNYVSIWVKNVGVNRIQLVDRGDLFFGTVGNQARIPYSEANPGYDYWNYIIEQGDTEWITTATIKVTVYLDGPPSGSYLIKFITHNGISDEYQFNT